MSNKFKIPCLNFIYHNETSYYYKPSDLKRLGSVFKEIINHFAKLYEDHQMIELPQFDYYVKTHSVAPDIAFRLGSIYTDDVESYEDKEKIYNLMATDCVK